MKDITVYLVIYVHKRKTPIGSIVDGGRRIAETT